MMLFPESAICSNLGYEVNTPINLVMQSRPSGCGSALDDGTIFDSQFCCDGFDTTSCYNMNVWG